MKIQWIPRDCPLHPSALWAEIVIYHTLYRRLAALTDQRQEKLTYLQTEQGILLTGDEALPWLDGVVWLGRDSSAPGLLLPTRLQPNVSLPLLEEACLAQCEGPVALIPPRSVSVMGGASDGTLMVSTYGALPVTLWTTLFPPAPIPRGNCDASR